MAWLQCWYKLLLPQPVVPLKCPRALTPLLMCCFLPSPHHILRGMAAVLLQVAAAVIPWCLPSCSFLPSSVLTFLAVADPLKHAHLGSKSQSGSLPVYGTLALWR